MKKIFFLIFALMFCSLGWAQNNNENKREAREKWIAEIQSRKIAFFTKHLQLTPEEAQKFWPVYNKCEEERNSIRREIRNSAWALHKATKEGTATDEDIRALAETYYENLSRETAVQKLHYYEYQKVLPIKKAAMVRMVEERFMNELLSQWRKQSQPKPKEDKN